MLVGAVAGVGFGLWRWRDYLAAGLPRPFATLVGTSAGEGAALGGAALLLFALVHAALTRRRSGTAAVVAAAAVPALPLALFVGYRFNRARGLRPADLLEPWGWQPNLALAAALAVGFVVTALALARWTRSEAARPHRPTVLAAGLVGVILVAANLLARMPRSEAPRSPPIVVILVDALRADHVSAYGYDRPTTPAIDRLAGDGVLFRQAIAASTFTKTSIASLFTGRFAYQHGVYWGNAAHGDRLASDVLPAAETTLAETLRDRGYLTAAFVQNSHLRADAGFAQGFVDFRGDQGPAARIRRQFLSWLPAARPVPWFAYLHLIDLHDPYRPEPPYDTMFGSFSDVYAGVDFAEWGRWLDGVRSGEIALSSADLDQLRAYYDGQLRQVDDQIGRLLDALRATGVYDDALVVVTADHGDAFMEHGFVSHSTTPYEELVRVPLIVKLPGARHRGLVVEEQVRLIDLLPTLLDAIGSRPPEEVAGCSLMPLIRGRGERDASCATAVIEIAESDAAPTIAVRTDGLKYIWEAGREELYDLRTDPGETDDLAKRGGPELLALRDLARRAAESRDTSGRERVVLDPRTVRELKALGYVQ